MDKFPACLSFQRKKPKRGSGKMRNVRKVGQMVRQAQEEARIKSRQWGQPGGGRTFIGPLLGLLICHGVNYYRLSE